MPFGSGEAVQQIVGSFKSISIEGGFKVSNLMGLRPKAEPAILVRAIIDRAFVPVSAGPHSPTKLSTSIRPFARAASTRPRSRRYPA